MKNKVNNQNQLSFLESSKEDYISIFKKLYYHLYSNSRSSRAETIIDDLSKILLLKLASTNDKIDILIKEFVISKADANDSLLKDFFAFYPNLKDSLSKFELESNAIRTCFIELDNIEIKNAPSHIIGDSFQSLIGSTLSGVY